MKISSGRFAAEAATSVSSPRWSFGFTICLRCTGGVHVYPRPFALDLLRRYRDLTVSAPDELTAYAALLVGHGHPMAGIALCHSGSREDGEGGVQAIPPCRSACHGHDGEKKYTEIQTMLDFTAPEGRHYYFKCPFLRELTDEAMRAIVEYAEELADRGNPSGPGAHARCGESGTGGPDRFWIETESLQHQHHARMD